MDWLTFIADITQSIIWPVVVLVFLIIARKRIYVLMDAIAERLIKAKLPGGIELEFAQKLKEASDKSEALEIEGKSLMYLQQQQQQQLLKSWKEEDLALAKTSPTAAIFHFFREVEEVILEVKRELPYIKTRNTIEFVKELNRNGLIDNEVVEQFNRVRELRNLVVHARQSFTIGEALEYRMICLSLAAAFRLAFSKRSHARKPTG